MTTLEQYERAQQAAADHQGAATDMLVLFGLVSALIVLIAFMGCSLGVAAWRRRRRATRLHEAERRARRESAERGFWAVDPSEYFTPLRAPRASDRAQSGSARTVEGPAASVPHGGGGAPLLPLHQHASLGGRS